MIFTAALLLLHLVNHNIQQRRWLDNFIFSTIQIPTGTQNKFYYSHFFIKKKKKKR